jgi:uncharacterized membrane protein
MDAIGPPPKTKAAEPSYRQLDVPYGCFACIALALCFGPLLWILPISQGNKEGYAMLLGIPIMFAAFLAGIVGLILAIVHRSEWQLVIMAFGGIVFLLTWTMDEQIMMMAAYVYGVVLVSCCGNWFFFRRRKLKRAERA